MDNHLEFRSGYEIHTGINFTKEGLIEDFDIFPSKSIVVPKSTYDHMEAQLYYTSPPTSKISFSVMNYIGGFFGGDRISSSPRLKIRFGDKFNSEISYNYNNVNLPGGNFITYLSRSRLTYSFNPKMYMSSTLYSTIINPTKVLLIGDSLFSVQRLLVFMLFIIKWKIMTDSY